jgi:signal transduction histidine kinase
MCETELVRQDGALVPVETRCRLLAGGPVDEGQPGVVMAMYRDLTAQRKLQQLRAEFTAMLAHDIRNPIGLILGCAELLLDVSGPPLDLATVQKCHQRIRDDARVLESLVSNYLDVSRIEAAQLNILKQPIDLQMIVAKIVERYQCEAEPRSIRLELTAHEGVIIEGDALALDRVFANLLHNAFKFTPDGGAIGVTVARRASDAVVEVRDNGSGIDPEKLPELFQKFSRIETGERREGLGLGLYIVSQLVVAHGGRVEVESALGNGSCFSVFLPLAAPQ